MATQSPPIGHALIICDAVHRDPATGKYTLLGTFSTIGTASLPAIHPQFAVFFVITECRPKTPITIRFVWLDREENQDIEILSLDHEIEAKSPLTVVEGAMGVQNLPLEREGEYRIQLESDGEPILERRLIVRVIPKPGEAS